MIFFLLVILCTYHFEKSRGADDYSAYHASKLSVKDQHVLQTHKYKESIPLVSSRSDILKHDRLHRDYVHELIIAIRLRNMEELTKTLHDVSDPNNRLYGHHLTRDEVFNLTSNFDSCAAVTDYLQNNDASIVSQTLGGEYITATATVAVWERMFNTKFFVFHQTHFEEEVEVLVRAEEYWIPNELHEHVVAVLNIIEMPILSRRGTRNRSAAKSLIGNRKLIGVLLPDTVTPALLRAVYNMGDSQGSDLSTQAVFANGNNYFNPLNLAYFQQNISTQPLQAAISIGNHNTTDTKLDCAEGNLDLQYIMSMSPGSPTTFWHWRFSLGRWLRDISNSATVPLVLSVSYGGAESSVSIGEHDLFTAKAIILGAMGVTIVIASGDMGAADTQNSLWPTCRYNPDFPSVNPYVVSVGATQVRCAQCGVRLFMLKKAILSSK
jgi:subtilase family serine protease